MKFNDDRPSDLSELISRILEESGYKDNPYFTSLSNGAMGLEDFVETQVQFYFAVVFFPRPMAAAAAKIPTHKSRLEIMRNAWEEHGSGSEDKFHDNTFIKFLSTVSEHKIQDIQSRELWPEVRAFNTTLSGACVLDEHIVSVGMLGMIELMFSYISTWIGQAVVNNGWVDKADLVHYDLHEQLDIKHSQDFFNVIESSWSNSVEDRYLIEQGLRLGAYCFNNLYLGLFNSRSTRRLSNTPILRHQRT
jgi:pyrroloquinoline-quinone synthase